MGTAIDYDLCVIGGGINGAGIARDAAGRGLSVLLVEQDDLASATSSASTKLIHGGLRYLEYFEFKLVREALQEREVLLRNAPHIIHPMAFVLPHDAAIRPAWMIRLGLFLYDHLAKRKAFPASCPLTPDTHPLVASPLIEGYAKYFQYSDGWVDDSRLVILNAVDAAERHATILTRTACTEIKAEKQHWRITLKDKGTDATCEKTARTVVNAAGPWVRTLLDQNDLSTPETPQMRLVKGSHIIVPRLYEGDHCYILQQPDKRIVFTIPYENAYTLVGTTEVDYDGDPSDTAIDEQEIFYLCEAVNRSFKNKIDPDRIVFTYSGVRPLLEDTAENNRAVTRDYKIDILQKDSACLYSVFGGKITTYRHLAEEVVNKISGKPAWTATAPLPGGDMRSADFSAFLERQKRRYDWCPHDILTRYAHAYGTRMDNIMDGATDGKALGEHFGDHLFEAEVRYMITHEFARTTEDILWRRSKLGMHVGNKTIQNLRDYLQEKHDA